MYAVAMVDWHSARMQHVFIELYVAFRADFHTLARHRDDRHQRGQGAMMGERRCNRGCVVVEAEGGGGRDRCWQGRVVREQVLSRVEPDLPSLLSQSDCADFTGVSTRVVSDDAEDRGRTNLLENCGVEPWPRVKSRGVV